MRVGAPVDASSAACGFTSVCTPVRGARWKNKLPPGFNVSWGLAVGNPRCRCKPKTTGRMTHAMGPALRSTASAVAWKSRDCTCRAYALACMRQKKSCASKPTPPKSSLTRVDVVASKSVARGARSLQLHPKDVLCYQKLSVHRAEVPD
ncbi:hypothetical protein GUJ93_ZPchr0005g14276 [Zizania palustris]|uniref:Uncharacterized protein n=1 Tax=Zizania palustris TaxID=103762 RepID=A0A8J5SC69_ZIZPA|nr:hypothetical protein GUJ93_ZPchr0005g14276 [Zizania palustris]